METEIIVAGDKHHHYAESICTLIADAAKQRGTGIAKRTPDYIQKKMSEGKAVIALNGDSVAGFCYIETWGKSSDVVNSGLIVNPEFRNTGLARKIKSRIFQLSREKFPGGKIFGITTSLAVMKINSDLGYKPVTFSELTDDVEFWNGCQSCPNYDILTRTNRSHCLCTGMLYDPKANGIAKTAKAKEEKWDRFKRFLKLRKLRLAGKLLIRKSKSSLKIFL